MIDDKFPTPLIIKPNVFHDARGWFYEAYSDSLKLGKSSFVQDNHSLSIQKGTLRGLHLQIHPFEQAKLIRVVRGEILDVVVDLRPSSPDFLKVYNFVLDDIRKESLFVPRGFAHGFITQKDNTEVYYKVDNYYSKNHELTLSYDDHLLRIDWMLHPDFVITSEKDKIGLSLTEVISKIKEAI